MGRAVPIPVFVVLGAWLVRLTGIAINVATTKPEERAALPGPLRPINSYPWPAVAILTAVASWLAWQQWRHSKPRHPNRPAR